MRFREIRRAASIGCCGLLAGVGAATARALEVPTLPAPTLPTPTVSVPVPVPTVPSVPLPAPAPPPVTTSPALPVPAPVPLPTTAPTTTPTPSLPAIGTPSLGGTGGGGTGGGGTNGAGGALLGAVTGSGGTASSPAGTSAPGTASSPAGTFSPGAAPTTSGAAVEGTRPGEHVVAVSARPTRHRPGVVTVRFTLAYARRLIVFVRGPLPSCNPTARFTVRGRRGLNAIRFNGTVDRRRLAAGSYLLGIKPATGSTVRWAAVHVGPRGAQPLPRRIVRPALDQCSSATAARALLLARLDSTPLATGGTAAAEKTSVDPPKPVEREATPEASVLPFSGIEQAAADLPPALGYFLLAVLGGSLLGLGVYVVHFMRSPSA
jgi:hypothetical protein